MHNKLPAINELLERLVVEQPGIPDDLRRAMVYTLSAPGKRIRSMLVLWCCELVSGRENSNARIAAAAIEMVHTYSLVHDDLPAMDDDDLRRGRPTCHKAFDEATAILTGDALLTLAFGLLAERIDDTAVAVALVRELAQAAGAAGMIAGQVADLKAENTEGCLESLEYIHIHKTAKMFRCAAVMGGLCGRADREQLDALARYGLKIGLGFQIADDILDVSASSEGRATTLEIVSSTAEQVFVPLTVGGGVRTVDDVDTLLRAGADKVGVNTAAIARPELIAEIADRFGAQVLVLSLDARRCPPGVRTESGYEVTTHGGRRGTGIDAVAWAVRAAESGAGEILLNSMDADGTTAGFDLQMLADVRSRVRVPLIASGGAGRVEDFAEAALAGADAVLAASVFHYGSLTIGQVKDHMRGRGVVVR